MTQKPRAFVAAGALVVWLASFAGPAHAANTLPILWEAGGLSAGTDGAGQAARIASDANGNVSVVSGPAAARDLAVTSYTGAGILRWTSAVSPASGTFQGDWLAAAPNGDLVAVGHNTSGSTGNPIGITMVRFGSDGALLWRVDLARMLPSVARLLLDSAGNAYLAFNSVGDGQDIELHKYDPAGVLLWAQAIATGALANDIASSLALSDDESVVAVTGDVRGGAQWTTSLHDAVTGARRWIVTAPEGVAALDVTMDADRVYVTGQGNVGINTYLSVVALDRATGARLWRTDARPADGTGAAGIRIGIAPDGSLVATGQASRGFLDWYTVALETDGAVRWEAVRDGGLNTDEIPAGLAFLPDGTAVVTGPGGPNLPGGYIPGVTAGYSPGGVLLWEAFSPFATVWVTTPPSGDVCATGGYDAYLACFRVAPDSHVGTPGGNAGAPPLRITQAAGALAMTWGDSCVNTDTDFSVYEGPIGSFAAHVPLACSTGSQPAATLSPSAGNTYYLVVAHDGTSEGSYGTDSAGNQRPQSARACLPMARVLGCP